MADFKTHVTVSGALGVGMATGGYFGLNFPVEQCVVGGMLCGVAGMLPDLDSKNGIPVRELTSIAAAAIPLLMLDRFRALGMTHEQIFLCGAGLYIGIRFGLAEIFKRWTVHRGMWHSVPAALIASLAALWICSCDIVQFRAFKAVAVFVGFVSHLILDEIYSIDLSGNRIKVKRSLGTALKFWSGSSYANVSTYGKLLALLVLVGFDPMLMGALGHSPIEVPENAKEWVEQVLNPVPDYDHDHDTLLR